MDLHTERVAGRRPTEADAPAYRTLLLDPEVERWLRPHPHPQFTAEEAEELLERDLRHWQVHGYGPWVLEDAEDGTFVGRAGLVHTAIAGESVVELVWALVPSGWGRGLATEVAKGSLAAAADLGVSEVVSLTMVENVASRRVMEKAGMRYAGDIGHAGLPHVLCRASVGRTPPGARR